MQLQLDITLLIILLFLNFLLGIIVILSGYKKIANRYFLLLTIFTDIWIFSNFGADQVQNHSFAIILTKLDFASSLIAIAFLLLLSFNFPEVNKKFNLVLKWCVSIITILCSVFSFSNLMISVVFDRGGVSFKPHPLYYFYLFILISFVVISLTNFIFNFIKSRGIQRDQIKYVLTGVFITLFLALFSNLVLPYFVDKNNILFTELSRIGIFGVIFLVGFTAYAIIKYQLFNIKVILTETAVGLVVLVTLIQVLLSENQTQTIVNVVMLFLVSYGGYLIIKSVLDEIKQKEELQTLSTQLSEANIHLKDLDKMKTEFVSLASHELLTPVSAIEGYLSMMLDEKLVTLEDPKAVQYMDRVYRSSKRLARLIADMLNISRIEEGRLLVEKKDIDMVELINQVLEELKFKAEEHKQKMVFSQANGKQLTANNNIDSENSNKPGAVSGKPSSQFMTFADPDKIKEVLVNLMGNSIKYTMEPGTITVTIEKVPTKKLTNEWGKLESIILAAPVDDQESIHAVGDDHLKQIIGNEQYLIRVKDQGVGIPKEELPKLFKKFHRVGNFSTQESQGTGLGLYITRALVELHHGRVWPDSEGMGKGSTFTFSLPTIGAKQAIIDLEAKSSNAKEQLKPLAKPMGNDDAL